LPLHRGRDFEFVHAGCAETVEIHSDFDSVTDADDDARRKCGQEIHGLQSAVEFAVDFPFFEDVCARNVEYCFLAVGAEDREGGEEKQQEKLERTDVS
jgi:hypothetical protein